MPWYHKSSSYVMYIFSICRSETFSNCTDIFFLYVCFSPQLYSLVMKLERRLYITTVIFLLSQLPTEDAR